MLDKFNFILYILPTFLTRSIEFASDVVGELLAIIARSHWLTLPSVEKERVNDELQTCEVYHVDENITTIDETVSYLQVFHN